MSRSSTVEKTGVKYPSQGETNPGLADFELSDYKGLFDVNFYELTPLIKRILSNHLPGDELAEIEGHLSEFGKLAGGEINELVFEAHKEEKLGHIENYDKTGNRVEETIYSPEQNRAKELAFKAGAINLDQHESWERPFHRLHEFVCSYLLSMNGEAGIVCPLGCNQGLINVLNALGTEKQKNKWLPVLSHPDSTAYFTAGQFMTERVGGSNIGANRTMAREGEEGKWYLNGEKWFCSNPGDVWVTTAQIEGTSQIGLFLVSRYKENGKINDYHILRKKEIIGWRGKLTVEMEYRGVEAEILGRPHLGLMNIMKYVITISRLGMSILASGITRRSYLEARTYAHKRMAYGKPIIEYPQVRRSLAIMQVMTSASELTAFDSIQLYETNNQAYQFTMPLLKLKLSMVSSYVAHEAIIILGGNGIISDFSVLPRMHNDSFIQEIGEGTHNIISHHAIKAFFKKQSGKPFLEHIESHLKRGETYPQLADALLYAREILKQISGVDKKELPESNWIPFLLKVYEAYAISLLIHEAIKDINTNDSLYVDTLYGFIDLCKYGPEGFLSPTSPLIDPEKALRIIG